MSIATILDLLQHFFNVALDKKTKSIHLGTIGHFLTYSNFFYPNLKNICKFQIISAVVGVWLGTAGAWPVVARVQPTVARVWSGCDQPWPLAMVQPAGRSNSVTSRGQGAASHD
jgi:hypothetical protein